MPQTRNEKLLHHIDPANQIGVEIGPLNRPTVTQSMGEIYYIDHTTTEALQRKYADDPNVDINNIVHVDYVWGEKSLAELTQAKQPFDYLIASHVIEHVPDLIGWLEEISTILKPGGILSLAIPDKHQCFDYERQTTQLCDVLEVYLNGSRQPTPRQIFDFLASFVSYQELSSWAGQIDETAVLVHRHSLTEAWAATKKAFESGVYYDVHCWVFTPNSFLKLLKELTELNLLKFEVVQFYETDGCEFFVSLRVVDNPVYPPLIQLRTEENKQLQLKDVEENKRLRNQLEAMARERQALESERSNLRECIKAMESSKFWQMRKAWFKLKQTLGLS